ncbi:MAG: ribosome biogenesis GTP-binding protein YihA/YsxC [Pseudomonadota bacterium]
MTGPSIKFLAAALRSGDLPAEGIAEIALAGRSNVGKSSLINALVGQDVARTSAVPGKTRTLNFYSVRPDLILVDLPGFGYAKVSQEVRRSWQPAVEGYLASRRSLRGVLTVVDIRRGLQAEERDLLSWLAHLGLPALVVLTKADKLKGNAGRRQAAAAAAELPAEPVVFSARTGESRQLLWRLIEGMAAGEHKTVQNPHRQPQNIEGRTRLTNGSLPKPKP